MGFISIGLNKQNKREIAMSTISYVSLIFDIILCREEKSMFFGGEQGELSRRGQLFYKEDEQSMNFEADSDPRGADCSILVVNLNIDFDLSTKRAQNIWGYHPYTMWIQKRLPMPRYFSGSLLLLDESISIQDVERLEGSLAWKTYYDSAMGWLCVGDHEYHEGDVTVEFLTNTLATLNKQGELKALWLKPIFVVLTQ
jgi:hypothetical protein